MTEPRTIPLSPNQQRLISQLVAQKQEIQKQIDLIATVVIAGTDVDLDSLAGHIIDVSNPQVGIVITPPKGG